MWNPMTVVLMGFEVALLLIIAACVFLKLIPNDLLILALGVVIRGALGVVPTVSAITQNTAATRENTAVTQAAAVSESKTVAPPQ
jgi:hypothetical protein